MKYTEEIVINRAKKIYGDEYDYSLVEYKNSTTKIKIICKIHGIFESTPQNHVYHKCGCPKCRLDAIKNKFFENCKNNHGNKYDYSLVEYKHNKLKICIICPDHGKFYQVASDHAKRSGCPTCAKIKVSGSDEKFITKSQKVHGNKYDYTLVVYKNNKHKVLIFCPKHGLFLQAPDHHLMGKGCNLCGRDRTLLSCKFTKEQFVQQAKMVHGDTYDYSLVKYDGMNVKVDIICPKHGIFSQNPYSHLNGKRNGTGSGCPTCATSHGEKKIIKYLKDNQITFVPQFKAKTKIGSDFKRFDFKCEYNGKIFLIEYQGMQHYVPSAFGSKIPNADQDNFKLNILRDYDKKQYCKENKIELLIIPYWKKEEINSILDCYLKTSIKPIVCNNIPKIVKTHQLLKIKFIKDSAIFYKNI